MNYGDIVPSAAGANPQRGCFLQFPPHKLSTPYKRSPFLWIVYAHAELPRPRVHAAADHEAVARLEDVQRTRHGGIRHGTHKDRHILCQAARGETDSALEDVPHTARVRGGFCRTRRRAYSDNSPVSSRWVLALSVCSSLKYCLINVSKTVVTMYFLQARYWGQQIRHVNRIHGQKKLTLSFIHIGRIDKWKIENVRALTCFKLSLQRGHWGVWSKQRSKQLLQKVWPHGVVTGS